MFVSTFPVTKARLLVSYHWCSVWQQHRDKHVGVIQLNVSSRKTDLGPVPTQTRSKTQCGAVLRFKKEWMMRSRWGSYINIVSSGHFVPKPPLILSKNNRKDPPSLGPSSCCLSLLTALDLDHCNLFRCFTCLRCLDQVFLLVSVIMLSASFISNCSQTFCLKTEPSCLHRTSVPLLYRTKNAYLKKVFYSIVILLSCRFYRLDAVLNESWFQRCPDPEKTAADCSFVRVRFKNQH